MPLTMLLLDFFEKTNLCNLDDMKDFEHDHWQWALKWFQRYFGRMKPLEKMNYEACPSKPGDGPMQSEKEESK